MATLGWLKIGITTDTSQFAKGLKRASKQAEDFGSSLKRLTGAYLGFQALKGAVMGLSGYVRGSIDAVATTKDMAERIGMTTEALGKLGYAAKLAGGMDMQTLEMNLEQMQKRLGQVALEGSGPAADALKKFGLSAKTLAEGGPEQALMAIVKMMEGITNPAVKARVAVDLFGKSGIGMINLVAMGSKGIADMGKEAVQLGFAVDSISASKIGEADDAFDKLSMSLAGLGNTLVTQLSPFIVKAVDNFIEWGFQGTRAASSISQGLDWIYSGIGRVINGVNILKTAFYGVQSIITEMFSVFASGINSMLEGIETLVEKFTGQKISLTDFFQVWSEDLDRLAKEQLDVSKRAFGQIGKGAETVRKVVDDIQRAADVRAKADVDKSNKFMAPGDIQGGKAEKTKFGGALELGSKEAFSSILRNKIGMAERSAEKQIAHNTARSAGAQERSEALLRQIAGQGAGGAPKALNPVRAAAF